MKQSGLRDSGISGISSNRNEDEELTILPMEVEIIQANRDEENERKKNKPRVKANSAGQEPPAVPPKAGFQAFQIPDWLRPWTNQRGKSV